MKSLWLVRHAKSSWSIEDLNDVYRPLNERGYRDAHDMCHRMKKANLAPDLIISSHAVRAFSTALIFANHFNYSPSQISITDQLYETQPAEYLNVIGGISDEYKNVMIFGHNPVITQTLALLTGIELEEMPTAAVAQISFTQQHWKKCIETTGKLQLLDYPKNSPV